MREQVSLFRQLYHSITSDDTAPPPDDEGEDSEVCFS